MYIALNVNCNILGVVYCSVLCFKCEMYILVYVTGIMYSV